MVNDSPDIRLEIFAGTGDGKPPFAVDAFVVEQDSDLLLDAGPTIKDPGESLTALLTSVENTKPQEPGTVLVRGRSTPYCFFAIVHDFSTDPSWKEQWVSAALDSAFRESEARRLEAIGLPLLGSVHGRLEKRRSVELLKQSLTRSKPEQLKRLWLLVPSRSDPHLLQPLREAGYAVTFKGKP